jgi:hypothetical protein
MADQENYTVEFTRREINSLAEVLKHFRNHYDEDPKKMDRPVFVAGAELSYKIGKVLAPDGDFTIEDYY